MALVKSTHRVDNSLFTLPSIDYYRKHYEHVMNHIAFHLSREIINEKILPITITKGDTHTTYAIEGHVLTNEEFKELNAKVLDDSLESPNRWLLSISSELQKVRHIEIMRSNMGSAERIADQANYEHHLVCARREIIRCQKNIERELDKEIDYILKLKNGEV